VRNTRTVETESVSRKVASPETDDSKGVTIHIVSTPNQHYPQLTQLNQNQGRSSIGTAEGDQALQLRNSKQAIVLAGSTLHRCTADTC
jgi:hypothetical protein